MTGKVHDSYGKNETNFFPVKTSPKSYPHFSAHWNSHIWNPHRTLHLGWWASWTPQCRIVQDILLTSPPFSVQRGGCRIDFTVSYPQPANSNKKSCSRQFICWFWRPNTEVVLTTAVAGETWRYKKRIFHNTRSQNCTVQLLPKLPDVLGSS